MVGLIEEAVSQTGSQEDADETVDEEWVEQLILDVLLFIESLDDEVSQRQTDEPA